MQWLISLIIDAFFRGIAEAIVETLKTRYSRRDVGMLIEGALILALIQELYQVVGH